jgi:predicted PurR-regulated permease PerM
MKRINWPLWAGFVVTLIAFLSYPFIFINWPVTRDFPWASLLLFALAVFLLFVGVRRAFKPGRRLISKIAAPIVATLSLLILAFFIVIAFIESRRLPASQAAPAVGQKAPQFTVIDINNTPVSLSDLLTKPLEPIRPAMVAEPKRLPKGVLLIFYRGYW